VFWCPAIRVGVHDSRRNWNPWDEAITPAYHPLSMGIAVVLLSSGLARGGIVARNTLHDEQHFSKFCSNLSMFCPKHYNFSRFYCAIIKMGRQHISIEIQANHYSVKGWWFFVAQKIQRR